MALTFAKILNANNYDVDAQGCSIFPQGTDTIWLAYDAVTSYFAADSTARIYARKYTISSGALSSEVDVSGAESTGKGWGLPSIVPLSASTIVCGYGPGRFGGSYSGFVIKESADTGATWGSTYSGGGSFNAHAFRGLFYDSGAAVLYAVTQAAPAAGGTVTVHKRTGIGTWTTSTAYSGGSSSNYFNLLGYPQKNVLVHNGIMCIVGSRVSGGGQTLINALYSANISTWSESTIATYSTSLRRVPMLVKGVDNQYRLVHTQSVNQFTGTAPVLAESNNYGLTWSTTSTSGTFLTHDDYGALVQWPGPGDDLVGLTIDGRDRQFITSIDPASSRMHVFRAWNTNPESWRLIESTAIATGTTAYHYGDLTNLPAPSCIVENDLFRVLAVWDATTDPVNPYSQLWLLKSAGAAKKAGGSSGGGGGTPRSFTEE